MIFTRTLDRRWPAVIGALLLAGCGGSARTHARRSTRTTGGSTPSSALGELLSVPAVGRIDGRCVPGARRWTIEFVPDRNANDWVTYRIGSDRPRTLNVIPGSKPPTWQLVPGAFTSHEPADPASRFPSPATAIKTTRPVSLDILQGTEPHVFRVKITLGLAAAVGDRPNCALVSSSMTATTYYTGGQPPS